MLIEKDDLFGIRNKVDIAIQRIKYFEPMALRVDPAGYYVCISGGKDSTVIQELCILAGVKCEFIHNHTSVDHPETVYFIREEKKRIEKLGHIFKIEIPRYKNGKQKTMFNGIVTRGLPLREQRWCCKLLKEFGGKNRYCITGVRWAESYRRRKKRGLNEIENNTKKEHIILNNDNDMRRRLSEICLTKNRFILNPIIDWKDTDVWEFIINNNLPFNPLYKKGYSRVGCIGCPLSTNGRIDLYNFPAYKNAYFKAAERHLKHREEKGLPKRPIMETPEIYFNWWLRG